MIKKYSAFLFSLIFMALSFQLAAQEEEAKEKVVRKPVRNTFESVWLIENQSVMVPIKGTFEFDINHRFGTFGPLHKRFQNYYGLFSPSNIRLGLSYTPIDNLLFGVGITKAGYLYDLNVKYAIVKQKRTGGFPLSVTYFANTAFNPSHKDDFIKNGDRFSYFHQLIVARKFGPRLSIQMAPSLSHFNVVQGYFTNEAQTEVEGHMKNDHLALSFGARYLLGTMAIIAGYDLPLTDHEANDGGKIADNPQPGLSFGLEINSSSHCFQIFLSNYYDIVPQQSNMFNQNNLTDSKLGGFLIGFNMTRLWNF